MQNTLRRSTACLLIILAPVSAHSLAAEPEGRSDVQQPVQLQLEQLNRSLEKIVMLLERSTDRQRIDLLMQRIELGIDRLSQSEQDLREARGTKASLEDEKLRIETHLASLADQVEFAALDMSTAEIEVMTNSYDIELKVLKTRIRSLELELVELENEVTGDGSKSKAGSRSSTASWTCLEVQSGARNLACSARSGWLPC